MRPGAMMRLLEDGSFLYLKGDVEVKLRIRSVATGDDVIKARAAGVSALAAKLFLPEAVEAAKREGVELINLEDVAEPLARVLGDLLRQRRADLLVRFFQELLPSEVTRSYSYYEYSSILTGGAVSSVSFKVEIEFKKSLELFEDVLEFISALAARASDLGMATSLDSRTDPRYKERKIRLEISLNLL
ncbi:hypothetical protein CGL51_12715 [Pyrobaculum aerophilum]|uniref:Uncharacterized protein n=2 Tax=Pyrobaculum aerophilum TaxID=13773 RepID=A0A371QUW9_9CREN|nr:hypothetical protein CGL51_12715 [Pyrobaculum aerophilum]RFA97224.1 hypothetical protein CGL52_09645 [Pyrobaculum aerophilum]